ncbi:MAG TPA: hypothetical protein VLA92_02245 [Candidatus Saccharimonadales bacterium]|nr:hypothetical protein [Candidatus Saccharimonadales bacterium]
MATPEVTLTPFDQLDASELRDTGYKAHFAAANLQTRAMLYGRNMIGAAERHATRQKSLDAVMRTQENMQKDRLAAFVIRSNGGWVGLGSVMEDLPLRVLTRPSLSRLPAGVMRRTSFVEPFPTKCPNVSAWIDASEPESTYSIVLQNAYELLRKEAGGQAWTIEPVNSEVSAEAIARSGMPALGGFEQPAYYDDAEVRGYSRVPLSNLFLSRVVAT